MSVVKFHNHACFSIEEGENYILVDPWFDGKVFNNSWSLLRATPFEEINLKKLNHIIYSHEHPDHLHFPTLSKIRELCNQNIVVHFPYRNKDNVRPVIEKQGYEYHVCDLNAQLTKISESISFGYFSDRIGEDHTIVFDIDGKILVNQNDHYTEDETIVLILERFPKIDILMTQFSLAGYYANEDDPDGLYERGHMWHLNRVLQYTEAFEPSCIIPFASFVYFCKHYNRYLNDYIVRPHEVVERVGKDITQLVTYGDEILWDRSDWQIRNQENLEKLEKLFDEERLIAPHSTVKLDTIVDRIRKWSNKIRFHQRLKKASLQTYVIELKDYTNTFIQFIPAFSGSARVLSNQAKRKACLSIPSDECEFMFRFPWGWDTAIIAATFSIKNEKLAKQLLSYMKDQYEK